MAHASLLNLNLSLVAALVLHGNGHLLAARVCKIRVFEAGLRKSFPFVPTGRIEKRPGNFPTSVWTAQSIGRVVLHSLWGVGGFCSLAFSYLASENLPLRHIGRRLQIIRI